MKVPELSDTSINAAASATGWGLFREASDLAPMCVSFMNGQQNPTIESSDADFTTLGILFRGYQAFGCDPWEYLSGVWSKGAA